MIEDRIRNIEERVRKTDKLPADTRGELLGLLESLRSEIATLPEAHGENAESLARFAEASTHEATRAERKPQLLEAALDGLNASVDEFEVSHPRLVDTINRIAIILSNMGM